MKLLGAKKIYKLIPNRQKKKKKKNIDYMNIK
jgi:hypothetical protein